MRLIHYGASHYDPARFSPIADGRNWVKPSGGLWTSPVGSHYGWKEWCEAEQFNLKRLLTSFEIQFTGRVFVIDTARDLDRLTWVNPFAAFDKAIAIRERTGKPVTDSVVADSLRCPLWEWCPLWEPLVVQGFDAVHLTERGQTATRHSFPRSLYGWDCESVLVMNPRAIQP